MTINEAERILGVSLYDDKKTIKIQFRKLMSVYHPDAVRSDHSIYLERAQQINEAYTLLLKNITKTEGQNTKRFSTSTPRRTVWKARVVNEAFEPRTIYMFDNIWPGSETTYIQVAHGRYEWDPDLEEFHCLLYSLNQLAKKILEDAVSDMGSNYRYSSDSDQDLFSYQVQLFHLLARQYISPVTCLKKIMHPVSVDEEGREIYAFDSLLMKQESKQIPRMLNKLKKGSSVYVRGLQHNRIMVSNEEGISLGYLSFSDDQLYYIVIPILQKKNVQVKCVIQDLSRSKVAVKLYLRVSPSIEEDIPAAWNHQILSLLKEYKDASKATR
ncbi:MAG: J domain-containing protein [Clostridia bacterium]|nr:J domain-containing protein [Clostridia bacterium]NCC43128.1 J domain-containing protein [Clostridia bacterium]